MSTNDAVSIDRLPERLSLIIGGPFHGFLQRLRLLGPDHLPGFKAAAILAAVTWLLPASLAVMQAILTGDRQPLGFFSDPSTIARFAVAVFALVIAERKADARITLVTDSFRTMRLVTGADVARLTDVLATADRRTSSRIAEGVILAVALVLPGLIFDYAVTMEPSSAWEGRVQGGSVFLYWAGHGARWVSAPLFQFLLLRWLWRFAVLTWLMFQLSRIPLQLSVLHPDRMGGLSFLALYPTVFNGLLFAVGSASAASFIRDLGAESIALETVQLAVAAWIGIVVAIVIGPLAAFVPCLSALKGDAVLRYGHLATQFHQSLERKWLGSGATAEDLMLTTDASTAADLNAIVASIWHLRAIPVDASTLFSVVLAAGIPMLAVLATQMPLRELASSLVSVVL
jgi:hypothetical protein